MIVIFGWGRHETDLGPAEWRDCKHCGNHGRWREIEVANRFSLFFVPVLSAGRKRWQVCPFCRTGFPADES